MELALIISAFLLGVAGASHCAAMCGAPCAMAVGSQNPGLHSRVWGFHLGRLAGYAAAGAAAAAGVGLLALAGSAAAWVRPLWALLHMAALGWGLWLLTTGRQPAFLWRIPFQRQAVPAGGGWTTMQTPWSASAAGCAWVAWPCGLLQSALVVAALGNTPVVGASVMLVFGMASAAGLQAVPWLAQRFTADDGTATRWTARLAGLCLVAGSAWALGHDLWRRVADYCLA